MSNRQHSIEQIIDACNIILDEFTGECDAHLRNGCSEMAMEHLKQKLPEYVSDLKKRMLDLQKPQNVETVVEPDLAEWIVEDIPPAPDVSVSPVYCPNTSGEVRIHTDDLLPSNVEIESPFTPHKTRAQQLNDALKQIHGDLNGSARAGSASRVAALTESAEIHT